MWKRILVFVMLLAVLALTYFFLRPHYRLPFDRLTVFSAVPDNSAALLRLPRLLPDSSASSAPLWYLDAKKLTETLTELQLDAAVEWESWWLLPVQGDGPSDASFTFIGIAASGLGNAWNPTAYGPETASTAGNVYAHAIAAGDPIYFGRHQNLFFAGRFPFQVESVLAAAKGEAPSWKNDERFQELYEAAKVLHRTTSNPQLILRQSNVESSLPNHWYTPVQLRFWNRYVDWLVMDFNQVDSACQVTAYSTAGAQKWLPNGTAAAWQWVPEIAELAVPLLVDASVIEGSEAEQKPSWLGDGGWQLSLPGLETDAIGRDLWVLPISDTTSFGTFTTDFLRDDQLTDQRNYQLYELSQLQSADAFDFLTDRQHWQPWFVLLPDAVVVSVYREELERYLDYHLVGGTLVQQAFFLELKSALPSGTTAAHQGFLRWGPLADAETNLLNLMFPGQSWANEGAATFSSSEVGEGVHQTEISIGAVPKRSLPATIRWTLPLSADEKLRLYPVRQLPGEPANFVLVQSESGRTWMVDLEGAILWEKPSLPPLYAPVWYWREANGAERWGATSSQTLHIWEENGNPLTLPVITSSPSTGLSVFSFDSRGTPTLAYPNTSQSLELRTTSGNLLEGWPAKLSGRTNAQFPLVHWETATEDYIIAWTPSEGFQFLGKKGQFMNSLPTVSETMLGAPAFDFHPLQADQSRLLGATSTGKVNVWDLEGNIVPIPLGRGPLDRWLFLNAWGDNRPDYVAQRGSLVHLFGYEDNTFAERWQQRFVHPPDTLLPAADFGTLVLNEEEQKIWLIDRQGQIPTAFPLAGAGGVQMIRIAERETVLITLLDGKVYAYDLILEL